MFAFWDVWLAFSPFNSPNNQGKGCLSEVYASCPRLHCSISSYLKTGFVFLFFLKNHWLVTLNIFYVPFCLHFDDLVSNCIIGSVAADGWWGKKNCKIFFLKSPGPESEHLFCLCTPSRNTSEWNCSPAIWTLMSQLHKPIVVCTMTNLFPLNIQPHPTSKTHAHTRVHARTHNIAFHNLQQQETPAVCLVY